MASERPLTLKGKLAIVTGASRGLGADMAWNLACRGANVCLTYVSEKSTAAVQDLAARIQALPHKPSAYVCRADVSTVEGPQQIIDHLLEARGHNLAVNILVNNAGVERVKSLAELSVDDYDAVFNLNVRGVILMTQTVLPYLQPKGRVINISSVAAREGFRDLGLYCASKAAVEGLTRVWATELGHNGTTVNAVNPGPVQTEMLDKIPKEIVNMQKQRTPVESRLGMPQEISDIVSWLAGDESGWISGQAISASGGYAMY
ncbi:dehydrogenase [Coniochaeta ligniaria NRRL 30616]|uniref:Dehydrogenase n=1 Tax=Coniochaeta ligniaria NRRL 30616 TaxID=1408157 RepID=A0A1J7JZY4_9PEZI|nr:dehydrogenase [Coniochaeta ligniaria NRRL 30616]